MVLQYGKRILHNELFVFLAVYSDKDDTYS